MLYQAGVDHQRRLKSSWGPGLAGLAFAKGIVITIIGGQTAGEV
jgi:hypothetical protein